LLAKDRCRLALADEFEPDGPEVAGVSGAAALACNAEGLARARAGPHWPVVWPAAQSKSVRPDADPCEKVMLRESSQVIGLHIMDTSVIDFPRRNMATPDQFTQPRGREWVIFVVIGRHFSASASWIAQ
jgi:hypothetical protein